MQSCKIHIAITKCFYFILLFLIACTNRTEELYWEDVPKIWEYTYPTPEDGEIDVAIRTYSIGFGGVSLSSELSSSEFTYEAYFDKVNPPKMKVETEDAEFYATSPPNTLSPNTNYYWKVASTYPTKSSSKVLNFKTASFDGYWKLYTLADKRAYLNLFSKNNVPLSRLWSNWTEWTRASYYSENGELHITNEIIVEDFLEEGVDFDEIQILENHGVANVLYHGNIDAIKTPCSIFYQNGSLRIIEQNNQEIIHEFPAVNLGRL